MEQQAAWAHQRFCRLHQVMLESYQRAALGIFVHYLVASLGKSFLQPCRG